VTSGNAQPTSPLILPRRGDEAIQDLVKDRHRGCEVEPDERRAIRIERLAGSGMLILLVIRSLGSLKP
jgi:hypothetical protein